MTNVDVVVVGSGLSGLLFSCAAIKLGLRVSLIEKSAEVDVYDQRAIVLGLKNKEFLEELGIWDGSVGFSPVKDIRVVDGNFVTQFKSGFVCDEPMGFVVRAGDLKKRMLLFAKESGLIKVNNNSKFLSLDIKNHKAVVNFYKNEKSSLVKCELCVVACGIDNNSICDKFDKEFYSYNQVALCFDIKHELENKNSAIEYFFEEGPLAILPLENKNESAVVFTTVTSKKERVINNIEDEIKQKIMHLGKLEINSGIKEYDLVLQYVKRYYSERTLLIGNSLHFVHPIAGQGWNLSIQDIKCFYEIMKESIDLGVDFWSNHSLLRFQRKRKPCNMAMIAITDLTNLTFSSNSLRKKIFRRAMMVLAERIPALKKSQMLVAMGYII